VAVDRDTHVDVLAVTLARRGRERGFDRLEDHAFVDALLVRDGIRHHQDLFAHLAATSYADFGGTSRASSISSSDRRHALQSTSATTCVSSMPSGSPWSRLRAPRARECSIRSSAPAKRSKCAGVRSCLSSPGGEISRSYAPGIGSSTSGSAPT